MSLTILISGTNYEDSVRFKIFATNDRDMLSDEHINNPIFVERAERDIKGKLPSWSGLTGDAADWLRDAVISQTCALLMPSVRGLMTTSEQVEGIIIKKDIDPVRMETDFYGEADYCLSQIASYSGSVIPIISGTVDQATTMFESMES